VANISVLVVDDHALMRLALVNLLQMDDRLSLCGEAANGAKALTLYRSLRPDVLLLDLCLPDISGVQVAREIVRSFPEAKIVIFSSLPGDHEDVRAALAAGASMHVRKTGDHQLLLDAIHAVGAAALERVNP
jgi:DNA-binding NarL/FixJ family response regulator